MIRPQFLRLSQALPLALAGAGLVASAQAPRPPHIVKVVGHRHKLALRSDGSVVGWGHITNGQLGPIASIKAHGRSADALVSIELPGTAIDVAAGDSTSFALLGDGTVWAWGAGKEGELGTGTIPAMPLLASSTRSSEYRGVERPVQVAVRDVAAIDAAGSAAFAILRDGTVRAWGSHEYGLIGDGRQSQSGHTLPPASLPTPVRNAIDVTKLSARESHVLALTKDGRVLSWGTYQDPTGVLGRDPLPEFPLDVAAEVPGLTDVASIAAGNDVSFALKRNGTVCVWGRNGDGLFGNGKRATHPSYPVPQPVPGVAGVVAISAAVGRHAIALLKDGTLRGWGNTDTGQIGAGLSPGFHNTPVTPRITNVKAFFAVGNNTFAVKNDNTLWGWGYGGPDDWPLPRWTSSPVLLDLK